ncbi:uncharacterized protein G2W53_007904 [Senna tora]|uniref:Uncharacterized protein n=1 Tax=Senna tora TaxID=362788 RepID=A0A834X795_9FABA|nr:uncharacterized protein G2W53_007904 [Senna tora]
MLRAIIDRLWGLCGRLGSEHSQWRAVSLDDVEGHVGRRDGVIVGHLWMELERGRNDGEIMNVLDVMLRVSCEPCIYNRRRGPWDLYTSINEPTIPRMFLQSGCRIPSTSNL